MDYTDRPLANQQAPIWWPVPRTPSVVDNLLSLALRVSYPVAECLLGCFREVNLWSGSSNATHSRDLQLPYLLFPVLESLVCLYLVLSPT
jgi:hypothetical protein